MSKSAKALAKILDPAQVRNVNFAEAIAALERSGFVWDGGKGSHQVYRHPDGRKMTLPKHGSGIKPVYVRQIREMIKP